MRSATIILLAFTLAGCAATITPDVAVTYSAEDVELRRLAILPVTAGEGLEGFRRLTADSLQAAIAGKRPELEVLPADSTLEVLNEAGLARDYSEMVLDYQRTGILDKETLESLGSALGAEHLLQVQVGYGSGKTTDYNILTGFETKRNQQLSLFAHIWSPERGDVVWEASGGARVEAGEFQRTRSVSEILGVACRSVVARMPRGPVAASADEREEK